MKVTKRTDKSLLGIFLQLILKPVGRFIGSPGDELPAGSPKLTPHASASKRCDITPREVCGIWIYDMTIKHEKLHGKLADKLKLHHKQDSDVPKRRIYYIAGGTWQAPPSPQHWKLCAELCYKIPHCTVSMVSCPLAPNSPAPKSFDLLLELYATLMAEDDYITFAGDSSGGNIVLCMVLAALSDPKLAHIKAPESLLVISPSSDLTAMDPKDPELKKVQRRDPVLTIPDSNAGAAKWAAEWDRSDSRLTPLNANVDVLVERGVKLYGVTGGNDIRTPAALLFKDKCAAAGVEGDWLDWDGQMHCFPLAWVYGLRESKEGKDWIIDVLTRSNAPGAY